MPLVTDLVGMSREVQISWCLLVVFSMRLLSKRKQTDLEPPLEDVNRLAKRRKTDQVCKLAEFSVFILFLCK